MSFSEFLLKQGHPIRIEKKEHVFRQGDTSGTFVFVKSGLLKAYYVTYEGKAFIKSFVSKNEIIGSLRSAFEKTPMHFSLVSLEPCELVSFDIEKLRDAAELDPEIAAVVSETLMTLAMKKERREYEFLVLSPEERYRSFLDRFPALKERITQNDIARYLGITPVALSRIRRRITRAK